jgi:hypothetical protein
MKNIQMERIIEDIDSCLNEASLALEDEDKGYPYVAGYLSSVLKTLQFQIKQTLNTQND